jgi:hypothetical protein
VAAIDRIGVAGLLGGALVATGARGTELPEDVAEAMFHSYNGGGVQAKGPAVLVRKGIDEKVSVWASYYVDMVSSASIDVVTTASPYKETRIERSGGFDMLARDGVVSLSSSSSREPDYTADRTNLDFSQDVFGGMTTLRIGTTRGQDDVRRHGVPVFSASASHWQYRAGITQVATTRIVASANLEVDSDTGYLGSPYRAARVFGTLVPERNPTARTSRALALRAAISIDPKSAAHLQYRYFHDTWGIHADTIELGYRRELAEDWRLDASVRRYSQHRAVFFSDDFAQQFTYMSRNRQLGSFTGDSLGAGTSWRLARDPGRYEVRLAGNLEWMRYRYADFTDLRTGALYGFNATLVELNAIATF